MFAIIKTGGKQFAVKPGDVVKVSLLDVDPESTYEFDEVLAVSKDGKLTAGAPTVKGAKVEAEVIEHGRDSKILVFKRKRRKDYKKRYGHRTHFTSVRIKDIKVG